MDKKLNYFIITLLLGLLTVLPSFAQKRRGLITSAPCPYSCRTQGIPKKHCRDWRVGNTCYIEDLRKHPAAPFKKGLITSAPCPYSCRTQGIPKYLCKDWRVGNTCYIEDLRSPPSQTTNVLQPPSQPTQTTPRLPINQRPNTTSLTQNLRAQCIKLNRLNVAPPSIRIIRVKKTGNFFKNHYRVRAVVEGKCIEKASVYERGYETFKIPVVTTPQFRQFEFEDVVNSDKNPYIRVYNVFGDYDEKRIDPSDYTPNGYPK